MQAKQRSPLLSARMDWIALEILILFVATVICTVVVWIDESGVSSQPVLEVFDATIGRVVVFSQFALINIIGIFELGGEIMLRYTAKVQQAHEQGKAEGIEQGREEIYRAWYADWEKRRQAATEKGIPFDEPPPPNPNHTNDA